MAAHGILEALLQQGGFALVGRSEVCLQVVSLESKLGCGDLQSCAVAPSGEGELKLKLVLEFVIVTMFDLGQTEILEQQVLFLFMTLKLTLGSLCHSFVCFSKKILSD